MGEAGASLLLWPDYRKTSRYEAHLQMGIAPIAADGRVEGVGWVLQAQFLGGIQDVSINGRQPASPDDQVSLARWIVFSTIVVRGAVSAFRFNRGEDRRGVSGCDPALEDTSPCLLRRAAPRLAAEAATRMLRELTESAFVETKFQNPDICDVYAFQAIPPISAMVAGAETICRAWYVKLTLLPEHVLLVSFHPLERPIRTARGKKVMP